MYCSFCKKRNHTVQNSLFRQRKFNRNLFYRPRSLAQNTYCRFYQQTPPKYTEPTTRPNLIHNEHDKGRYEHTPKTTTEEVKKIDQPESKKHLDLNYTNLLPNSDTKAEETKN